MVDSPRVVVFLRRALRTYTRLGGRFHASCSVFFVVPQYLELDEDQNGMLSKRELMNYGERPLRFGGFFFFQRMFFHVVPPLDDYGAQRSNVAGKHTELDPLPNEPLHHPGQKHHLPTVNAADVTPPFHPPPSPPRCRASLETVCTTTRAYPHQLVVLFSA